MNLLEYYYHEYGATSLFMRRFNSYIWTYGKINYILQTFLWFKLVTIPCALYTIITRAPNYFNKQ